MLGPPGTPEADFRAIVWRHRLPREFPKNAVLAQAARLAPERSIAPELARRLDLRGTSLRHDRPGDRARSRRRRLRRAARRRRLSVSWVAIADVSHFVARGRPLDREALRRGNSVYFPDRAIPMLPERLSGELCSLRPQVDRLVLAAELALERAARSACARFHEAVIRSRARLVYDDAARVMEGRARPTCRPAR